MNGMNGAAHANKDKQANSQGKARQDERALLHPASSWLHRTIQSGGNDVAGHWLSTPEVDAIGGR